MHQSTSFLIIKNLATITENFLINFTEATHIMFQYDSQWSRVRQ